MDLTEYQQRAQASQQVDEPGAHPYLIPALGVAGEAGSIANAAKKFLRDGIDMEVQRQFLKVEIGDSLWYLANLATQLDLDLGEVAEANIQRIDNRYGLGTVDELYQRPQVRDSLDERFPEEERFPRWMRFQFSEDKAADGQSIARMVLLAAEPNCFPEGKIISPENPKGSGFEVGDPLRDNSVSEDGYRYHDALHLAFLGVLGWSPVLRSLLRLKRKSDRSIDDSEDSQRAVDVEEGLTSYLAVRSQFYDGFADGRKVDNETLDIVLQQVSDYEVSVRPGWLWKVAISRGFNVMKDLRAARGGYVTIDLDRHTIEFSKIRPAAGRTE